MLYDFLSLQCQRGFSFKSREPVEGLEKWGLRRNVFSPELGSLSSPADSRLGRTGKTSLVSKENKWKEWGTERE